MRTSRQSAPSFFKQGLLILLPVVVLAGAGLFSIRQDRAMAQREATEKAQAFADQIADVLWRELTDPTRLGEFTNHTFRIDGEGRLLFPPPAPTVPVPQPFNLSTLNETQRRLWITTHAEVSEPGQRSGAIAACREFLAVSPPTGFVPAAHFRLALLLEADSKFAEARVMLDELTSKYPEARSESGLPLAPLAEWKRIQFPPTNNLAAALDNFCSNLVEHPTFLTPQLLNEARKLEANAPLVRSHLERWSTEWQNREALRLLATAALAQTKPPAFSNITSAPMLFTNMPPVPKVFWFHARDLLFQAQQVYPAPETIHSDSGKVRHRFYRNSIGNLNLTNAEIVPSTFPTSAPAPTYPPAEIPRFWLATRHDDVPGDHRVVCRVMGLWLDREGRTDIRSPNWRDMRDLLPQLPEWFGYSLELAGETLVSGRQLEEIVLTGSESKGSGPHWKKQIAATVPEILAVASRFEQGNQLLRVNVHLTSPQLLFARQRTRSLLFGGLIAASALAAIIGFISARRGFLRQQQLSELKSNFVSSVSHELRAPIASVRLLAESLERGKISEPAKQHEYFRFIVQECRRLSSLIENVLDFARIEQGRKQYEFEPTDLSALLRQTVQLMEPAAAEKHITIATNLDDPQLSAGDLQLTCDGSAIQQALVNLIDNALKHSPPGETVSVELRHSYTRGSTCRSDPDNPNANDAAPSPGGEGWGEGGPTPAIHLSVSDHGPGIPPQEHERIFERFYRRGSELRRETQGVGIGLSIVKHIVAAHGGRVRVESEIGQGSRFIIELPFQPTAETQRRGGNNS